MAGLIIILLYACKLALLASSTCVKIIEFSPKNEARKAYLHLHKIIILCPPFMKEVYKVLSLRRTFYVLDFICFGPAIAWYLGIYADLLCQEDDHNMFNDDWALL